MVTLCRDRKGFKPPGYFFLDGPLAIIPGMVKQRKAKGAIMNKSIAVSAGATIDDCYESVVALARTVAGSASSSPARLLADSFLDLDLALRAGGPRPRAWAKCGATATATGGVAARPEWKEETATGKALADLRKRGVIS